MSASTSTSELQLDLIKKSIHYIQKVTEDGLAIDGLNAGIIHGFEAGANVNGVINHKDDASPAEQHEDAEVRAALVATFQVPQLVFDKILPMSPVSEVMLNYLAQKISSGEFKEQDCETWIESAYYSLADFAVKLYKHVYLGEGDEVKPPTGPPGIESLIVVVRGAVIEKNIPGETLEWTPPWVNPASIISETMSAISAMRIPDYKSNPDSAYELEMGNYINKLMAEWIIFSSQPHTVPDLLTKKNEIMHDIDLFRTTAVALEYKTEESLSNSVMPLLFRLYVFKLKVFAVVCIVMLLTITFIGFPLLWSSLLIVLLGVWFWKNWKKRRP